MNMERKFRNLASFGKRIEFWVIGKMLKEGLDIYIPLVDDMGIDGIVRKKNGTFLEIQIKGRSKNIERGHSGVFANIRHDEIRKDYYFVFYAERMDTIWIMSSEEFINNSGQNKKGKNVGTRTIQLNGVKGNEEFTKPEFKKYVATNFDRLK